MEASKDEEARLLGREKRPSRKATRKRNLTDSKTQEMEKTKADRKYRKRKDDRGNKKRQEKRQEKRARFSLRPKFDFVDRRVGQKKNVPQDGTAR